MLSPREAFAVVNIPLLTELDNFIKESKIFFEEMKNYILQNRTKSCNGNKREYCC